MIEQGKYRGRAREWALGIAGTGTKQIGVVFDILDMPGEKISWYGYFTDGAFDRTIESMRHCGWEGVDLTDLSGMDRNEVILVVEHEPVTDASGTPLNDESGHPRMRAKVRWVNSQGGLAMANALEGNDLAAFAAQMRGRIAALDPRQARARPAARPASGQVRTSARSGTPDGRPEPPPIGDDIPF